MNVLGVMTAALIWIAFVVIVLLGLTWVIKWEWNALFNRRSNHRALHKMGRVVNSDHEGMGVGDSR